VELPNVEPHYFFVLKDFEAESKYSKGFSVNDLFIVNNVGIVTSRDSFVTDNDRRNLENRIKDFFILDKEQIQQKYNLKENKSWNIYDTKNKAEVFNADAIQKVSYRPFDDKFLYYEINFIERNRKEVMQHFLKGENIGLMTCRQIAIDKWEHVGVTKNIADDSRVSNRTKERGYIFPLYLYPETSGQQTIGRNTERTPNLNAEIIKQIVAKLGLSFTNEKETTENTFAPIDILDYIYAVLHSPSYREKYKEFLKIDFPRVPYPKNKEIFWQLVKLGGEIRQIHLLESPKIEQYITTYPQDGDNVITRKLSKNDWEITDPENQTGRIWINDQQYFDNIPLAAWEFYIGGYQPAQKWLKDRRGRELSFDDILHYQKIIVALSETDRLMKEINKIGICGIF